MLNCTRDGGLALRSRPAGGGFKPPTAALVKACRGERCGKRHPLRCQVGVGKTIAVDVSKNSCVTPKPGWQADPGTSLAGARLLARWCPAYRRREPGQAAFVRNGRERAPTLSPRQGRREGESQADETVRD